MAPKFRLSALALAIISICLSAAVLGCAGRPLHVFHQQQRSNAWFLPIWPNHFETRELQTLLGTSAVILILNAFLAASQFLTNLPPLAPLLLAALSAFAALLAIVVPPALANHNPATETLQSWTCRWSSPAGSTPAAFPAFCHETRFAFYASIPLFLLQLALLTLTVLARARPARFRSLDEPEKGEMQLESIVVVEGKKS